MIEDHLVQTADGRIIGGRALAKEDLEDAEAIKYNATEFIEKVSNTDVGFCEAIDLAQFLRKYADLTLADLPRNYSLKGVVLYRDQLVDCIKGECDLVTEGKWHGETVTKPVCRVCGVEK